jgi:hypothetical protein
VPGMAALLKPCESAAALTLNEVALLALPPYNMLRSANDQLACWLCVVEAPADVTLGCSSAPHRYCASTLPCMASELVQQVCKEMPHLNQTCGSFALCRMLNNNNFTGTLPVEWSKFEQMLQM